MIIHLYDGPAPSGCDHYAANNPALQEAAAPGLASGWFESQRNAVHAIAQAGGLWSIIEDMAEMSAAARAMDFGAAKITRCQHGPSQRLPEARPAGAAFKLGA